jgi:hypothetical protein
VVAETNSLKSRVFDYEIKIMQLFLKAISKSVFTFRIIQFLVYFVTSLYVLHTMECTAFLEWLFS